MPVHVKVKVKVSSDQRGRMLGSTSRLRVPPFPKSHKVKLVRERESTAPRLSFPSKWSTCVCVHELPRLCKGQGCERAAAFVFVQQTPKRDDVFLVNLESCEDIRSQAPVDLSDYDHLTEIGF